MGTSWDRVARVAVAAAAAFFFCMFFTCVRMAHVKADACKAAPPPAAAEGGGVNP